ncbi:FAD linked oxidase domain protein [Chondrocystis sp. NIES-4102]|nr:FAD linked oxidase domain protein [Chondrocystis sp. NIES-4102]
MTTAIATQLKSLLDNQTQLLELSMADSYWQNKIAQVIVAAKSPIYLVFPSTVEVLAKIVNQAFQQRWRILICGNATKLNWGNLSCDIQLIISTQKCDRLVEHAVGDLTVTVEAGMKLADLQAKLKLHQQFLPLDPTIPTEATLGGIVATGDAGSWRHRYGGVRDLLLGLSFVRADGAIATGGGRVVKNVAGYDLMKLFTGSYGTLGIITQLTFRTYPLIPTSETILLTGKAESIAQLTQFIRNSGLTPISLDLLSTTVVKQIGLGNTTGLIIGWQTIPASSQQQINQISAIAQQLDLTLTHYQGQAEIDLWQQCNTITTVPNSATAVTCKLGIIPTAAVDFLQLKVVDQNAAVRIHAGSGIGQLHLDSAAKQIMGIRSYCQANSGFLTILDAPISLKQQIDSWGYTGNALSTMQTLKNQFDPHNLLNPSRFLV